MSWESVKIPDVLFFQEGPGVRNTQFTNHGVKLLNVGNINFGNLNLDATKIYISDEEAYGKYKHFLVDEGDLLIASSGIVVNNFHNKITWASKEHLPLCLNTSTIRFKTLDPNVLDIRYFSYFLKTRLFADQLAKLITGSAQLNFGSSHLKQISLPLPPLATQKRIAEILDAADALRRKDQELLKKYDELAQAIFIDMFGDPVKNEKGWDFGTVRDVATEVKYGTSKPAEEGGRYPYLRMNNITYEGDWDFKDLKYINLDESEKNKYLIKKGDLVFNRTNSKELVGKTAVYNQSQEMAIAGYLIRVRTNEKANSNYISAYLNSKHGKKTLLGMCKSIIGMANINAQELQDISIMIPPIELQNKFSQIVRQIEQLKIKIVTQKSFSENVFNSTIQKAFKGELV